jgi:RND family efflux transporter MFP subunit
VNAQPELPKDKISFIRGLSPFDRRSGDDRSGPGLARGVRWMPPKWLIGVFALLLIVVAIWAARSSSSSGSAAANSKGQPQALQLVSVMTPQLKSVTSTVSFTGAIAARYDMPISAEGEGGRITAVYVEAGDHVRSGQILAKLDQSVLLPQLNRLAASLEEAKAQAALSHAEYGRAQGVEAAGALSKEEIERRRAASATDDARVRVAAAQLAEAEARLSRTEIRAPADGTVLTREADVGQTATPGGPALFRLARGGEVEMRGQVAEQELALIKVNQPATVSLTGVATAFPGRVRLLGAVIDPQTRLGEIRISLTPDPALRPGAFARGQVTVGEGRRPVLPQTAVLTDNNGAYVVIIDGASQAVRRPVRTGQSTPDGVVISEGLTGEERVVATAAAFLRPGEKVEVASSPARTPATQP